MRERDDGYVVTMRLPDYRKEQLRVGLRDGHVTVRASRRTPEGGRETFARSFRLPADADPDGLEASFEEGTLTLRIERFEVRHSRSVALR